MGQEIDEPGQRCRDGATTIVLAANSFWNIANFRAPLVDALAAAGYRLLIAAPDVDESWVRERGAAPIVTDMQRSSLNPFSDLGLFIDYLRAFRRHRPDFYLGFTVKPNIYGSMAAAAAGAVPVPNVSGLGTAFMREGMLSRFVGGLYRLAFRRCPLVFFQNPDDRELFVERRIIRSDQARLLPGSGIDLDHFSPRPAVSGPPRFLFIGRLLGDKGVREFATAARMLKQDHPDWRFLLLGELDAGNRSAVTSGELQSWIEQGAVERLGQAEDVRAHITNASAVVLPSYREGLPRALLEGAAMARPLVATDVPGCREVVRHGENGFLCRARDAQSLAEAMRQLGELGREQRAEMGRAGRRLAEERFGQERVVSAYLDAIAQLSRRSEG